MTSRNDVIFKGENGVAINPKFIYVKSFNPSYGVVANFGNDYWVRISEIYREKEEAMLEMDRIYEEALKRDYQGTILFNYKAPYKLKKDDGDNGWDIQSIDDVDIFPGETKLISTGLYIELTEDYYADVRPRSGLSSKGIFCKLGLVDSSYRGEIKVCLYNSTDQIYEVKKGDRVGQLVIGREIQVMFEKAKEIKTDTKRGSKGFGSSGK